MIKQSERVREIVKSSYVNKAKEAGLITFSIKAGDVLKEAEQAEDFPRARTPLICNVLQSKKLLEENGIEIESIEGPPSRQSRRVVVHYRVLSGGVTGRANQSESAGRALMETPEERAFRLTEKLRGLMKEEIAAHGGAEGYLRWVRGEDEEAA